MNCMTTLKDRLKLACETLELREHEPMRKHTSFRIGGPIALMALPKNKDELSICLKEADALRIAPLFLGKGSNLLVTDEPLSRFAIKYVGGADTMRAESETIFAESGVTLSQLAVFAMENDLTGLEFAHGIPGYLGGAIYMNAGAYGGEMSQVVREVVCLTKNGLEKRFSKEEAKFSYRHSVFFGGEYYILATKLQLKAGNRAQVHAKMADFMQRRRDKQPLDYASAGSTFKRPTGYFAGELIEKSGLKGKSVGGAQVSEKHAGFVVNKGDATCSDVLNLIKLVQNTVYEAFQVQLETEVQFVDNL